MDKAAHSVLQKTSCSIHPKEDRSTKSRAKNNEPINRSWGKQQAMDWILPGIIERTKAGAKTSFGGGLMAASTWLLKSGTRNSEH